MKLIEILDNIIYRWIMCVERTKFKLAQKQNDN